MLLEGKKIIIMGVRNKWSIAWGAAQSAYENGAEIIFTYGTMENKEKIENLLKEKLKKDRTKTQVEGFTKLDLMEMTRKHICSHKE